MHKKLNIEIFEVKNNLPVAEGKIAPITSLKSRPFPFACIIFWAQNFLDAAATAAGVICFFVHYLHFCEKFEKLAHFNYFEIPVTL